MKPTADMSGLAVNLAGVTLSSPLILASGILGTTASSLCRVARSGAGAVTSKSCGLVPRKGHPSPSVLPWAHGLINAVGLSNPGADLAATELRRYRARCQTPLLASIFGRREEEFAEVAAIIAQARPDLIEVNVSCPNVEAELGQPFGADFRACARITRLVKEAAGDIPVSIKLTATCPSISRMARVCEDSGADAITAINTVGPGMLIDTRVRRPVLSNLAGGISGPAILPIAVRSVFEIYRVVRVPIIGTGGVTTAEDALQMIMAGATAVGIGSGVYYGGLEIFRQLNDALAAFLAHEGLESLEHIRGAAHES